MTLRSKLATMIEMGYDASDAALALCSAEGDADGAFGDAAASGLRRRFALLCAAAYAGTYHLDGSFCGAARYRHCGRNDCWILRSLAFCGDGWTWKACDHPQQQGVTAVELSLPKGPERKSVGGIIEFPGKCAWSDGEGRRCEVQWTSDEHGEDAYVPAGTRASTEHDGWVDLPAHEDEEELVEVSKEEAVES
jgi:hypothetical protein